MVTTAYVLSDISAIAMPLAPPPPRVSNSATGTGEAGTVMSMICTPSLPVTTAYVLSDISAIATPSAPSSAVNPSIPSEMAATGETTRFASASPITKPIVARAITITMAIIVSVRRFCMNRIFSP